MKCNVADYGCLCPANGIGSIRSVCFRCGMPVCRACSSVRTYGRYGRKRICNDCEDEIQREFARQKHRCATIVFPLAGEVGTCVDCGKRWTRTEVRTDRRRP